MYLTHGHHANPDNLPPLTAGSVFLSGHTHVKLDKVADGIRCLNPGSVSIPKDGSHSCIVFENGEIDGERDVEVAPPVNEVPKKDEITLVQ
jgi:predicted phosphodiesterase